MKKHHQVENVRVEKGDLILIVDGARIQLNLKDISSRLATATDKELEKFDVSPSGYGIHWSLLDEDISIDGLLGIVHSPNKNRKSA